MRRPGGVFRGVFGRLVAASALVAAAGGMPTLNAALAGQRTVSYGGLTIDVPADLPIIDLDAAPRTCVRLDQPAVYLGTPSADQDCPAHAVGRADTIWIGPATSSEVREQGGRSRQVGGRPAIEHRRAAAGEATTTIPSLGLAVRTSWADSDSTVGKVIGSARVEDSAGPTSTPLVTEPAAAVTAVPNSTGTRLTGMAFDTCSAPSLSTMSAWKSSPYAAVGIYIGGSVRACPDGNLSAGWVSSVTTAGWGLIPIYVGLQAPCDLAGLPSFTAANAASEGTKAGADAVAMATKFGIAPGSPLYFDMENYATGDASCSAAVLDFLSAYGDAVHTGGYLSAVYGNVGSLMTDMSNAITAGSTTFIPPDQIWFARWDGIQTVDQQASAAAFKDAYWSGKRLKQYRGDYSETWGGVTIRIDGNWSDAPLPGNPKQVVYGAGVVGPGSAGFVLTGNTVNWHPAPGTGFTGRAYWTTSSGTTTDTNGATWTPSLDPGLYRVDAYVPPPNNSGVGAYTVTDGSGSRRVLLNQAAATGYQTLGTVVASATSVPRLHLGNDGGGSGTISADAVRFVLLADPPGAPSTVTATAANASALVSWGPAAPNGAPVTAYRVVANPGGAAVDVPGTATQATVPGLSNLTSYTFSVTATNVAGTGPAVSTVAVVPLEARSQVAGLDRYATAVAVSKAAFPTGRWPDGSPVTRVVVATGGNYPDALSAGPLTRVTGPLLLVPTSGQIPASVTDEIRRLAPAEILVIGGAGAISAQVLSQLGQLAPARVLAGLDRYATAATVVDYLANLATSLGRPAPQTVILASGETFADALAGGGAATAQSGALLLTARTYLPSSTAGELSRLRPSRVLLLGGSDAVNDSVLAQVRTTLPGTPVTRVSGLDRFATATALSQALYAAAGPTILVNGLNFPDALSASSLIAIRPGPVLLTFPNCAPAVTVAEAQRLRTTSLTAVGGSDVVGATPMNLTSC